MATKSNIKSELEKIMWGADPEFFAVTVKEDGNTYAVPPVYFRDDLGLHSEPNGRHPIFMKAGGAIVHEDGAAFEMSVPPNRDWRVLFDMISNTRALFSNNVLSKFGDNCTGELMSLPSVWWDVSRWADRGPEFQMATEFGCDPDKDVYGGAAKCAIFDASLHPRRYAGGHIHVSGPSAIEKTPLVAIRSMVMTAGLASIGYSDVPELEKERLFRYGKPGKFRVQKYSDGTSGIEYRSPSTRWTNDPNLATKVFKWAEIGIKNLLIGGLAEEIADKIELHAREAIVNVDQPLALELLDYIESKI